MFGSIFWRLKKDQAGIQDRLGLLQVRFDAPLLACTCDYTLYFGVDRKIILASCKIQMIFMQRLMFVV